MSQSIFGTWSDQDAQLWGHVPRHYNHNLHQHPLFSAESLGALIDRFPRSHYSLIQMGAQGGRRFWREGDLAGMKGQDVLKWIAAGRMWINLRTVQTVDPRYKDLLEGIYDQIASQTGTGSTFNLSMGILVSSPMAQVYYHADMLGQTLWQIAGRKRVYVYPNHAPFLTQEQLEDIAFYEVEVDTPYQPWYDQHAQVFELAPGMMAHWPLNAPHRVENLDMLNISVTTEHMDAEILRSYRVTLANAVLRKTFGMRNLSPHSRGLAYRVKSAVQGLARRSSWLKTARKERRPIEFMLDPSVPGGVIDVASQSSRPLSSAA